MIAPPAIAITSRTIPRINQSISTSFLRRRDTRRAVGVKRSGAGDAHALRGDSVVAGAVGASVPDTRDVDAPRAVAAGEVAGERRVLDGPGDRDSGRAVARSMVARDAPVRDGCAEDPVACVAGHEVARDPRLAPPGAQRNAVAPVVDHYVPNNRGGAAEGAAQPVTGVSEDPVVGDQQIGRVRGLDPDRALRDEVRYDRGRFR